MSQERRERQQERSGKNSSERNWVKTAAYAALIAVAFALAYYLGNRSQHKHDAFAKCLSSRGLKMYGAYWCPHCQEQKAEFGASFEYVPYVECGVQGDVRAVSPACKQAGIQHYPTWQFPPMGERVERVFSLEELRDRTGCDLHE